MGTGQSNIQGEERTKGIRPLIFLHIHKTAGTSLRIAIREAVGKKRFLMWYETNERFSLEKVKQRLQRSDQVVFGHQVYGAHRDLGVPPNYATVLREPISRVLSFYYYVAEHRPDHPCHEAINQGMSAVEFVSRSGAVANRMVKVISGQLGPYKSRDEARVALRTAKRNLRRDFALVGTVEDMERTLEDLSQLLGVNSISMPQENVGVNHDDLIGSDEGRAIGELNELDMELYEFVCEEFRSAATCPANLRS